MKITIRPVRALTYMLIVFGILACVVQPSVDDVRQHRWWSGLGPVLPHDSFPADCSLCHLGEDWHELRESFDFDHEAETGVALLGAHANASCLRCHNDRGPVASFAARGCGGCHEDVHIGQLGQDCLKCHQRQTWEPIGMLAQHNRTRFPLVGVHAATACRRCHEGAEIGRFKPLSTECHTCHAADLARANNPNHIAFGWTRNCDECHVPTTWSQAEVQ